MSGQPIWLTALLGLLGAGSLVGGVGAIIGARASRELGVQNNDIHARAEEASAEDRIIGRWETVARDERAARERTELERDVMEKRYEREREYTEILRRHIWEAKG